MHNVFNYGFVKTAETPFKEKIPVPALWRAESFYVTADSICSKCFAFWWTNWHPSPANLKEWTANMSTRLFSATSILQVINLYTWRPKCLNQKSRHLISIKWNITIKKDEEALKPLLRKDIQDIVKEKCEVQSRTCSHLCKKGVCTHIRTHTMLACVHIKLLCLRN